VLLRRAPGRELVDGALVAHVGNDGDGTSAVERRLGGDGVREVRVDVDGDEAGAELGEDRRRRASDAACGTGHDDRAAFEVQEIEHRSPPCAPASGSRRRLPRRVAVAGSVT